MVVALHDPARAAPLFDGWPEAIIWSCLDGTMGTVFVDDPSKPASAAAFLGDFCFFAGSPNQVLVRHIAGEAAGFLILIPQNDAWASCISHTLAQRVRPVTRYAIRKDTDFDIEKLRRTEMFLPEGYSLHEMDEINFAQCRSQVWSADLVSQFQNFEAFQALGVGVVVCQNGEVLAGASTYARYRHGIEIEVDTRKDMRRRGLAYACCAKLILLCLERGLYPSWDAHNPASVALAEKLGYRLDHPYLAFELFESL